MFSWNTFKIDFSQIFCLMIDLNCHHLVNQFPGGKLLNQTKLKAFAEDILNVTKMIMSVFNPFPNKPWFLRICSASCLKTLWGKEKLLATSNFSFSHSIFYPFRELSAILIKFEIVVCKLSNFGISPFPTMFSKDFFPRPVKRCHCVGMGERGFAFLVRTIENLECCKAMSFGMSLIIVA